MLKLCFLRKCCLVLVFGDSSCVWKNLVVVVFVVYRWLCLFVLGVVFLFL